MDAITIGWNKHSSDEVQYLPKRQLFQVNSIELKTNEKKEAPKKRVHFSSDIPISKHQAFKNTELNHFELDQTQRLSFEGHNYISSSTNIFSTQLPTVHDKPIWSARTTAISCIIIIIVIVIVVAITVGVVFGTVSSLGNHVPSHGSRPPWSPIFTGMSTVVMTSSVSIGSQNGTPCSSYTTINDPSRNVAQIGSSGPCDNGTLFNTSKNGAWIRFIGNGGTKMASSPPGPNHCGGYATGWFNGTLPTILDATVNGSVCLDVDTDACIIFYKSSVIYCTGNFYIYSLQPVPICNTRYCTT